MAARTRSSWSAPSAARPVAAGGWRRAAAGALVGLSAGAVLATVLPREGDGSGGRRRRGTRR